MPFPPTFDRAWDETFPPDTQLANLLGQDIRNFKTDIRERLSLISGTFVNRPSNMDAIYGGSGFGILYFSTDTGQIFQWNGAAWVDVSASLSSRLLNAQGPSAGIVGNGAFQNVFTFNLGANVVGNLQGIRLRGGALHTAGSFNGTYQLLINGVLIGSVYAASGGGGHLLGGEVLNTGATTGVFTFFSDTAPPSGNNFTGTLAGLNWAGAQTLAFQFNFPNTDTITPNFWSVELM